MAWRGEARDGVLEHTEVVEQDKVLRWRAIRGWSIRLGENCGLGGMKIRTGATPVDKRHRLRIHIF